MFNYQGGIIWLPRLQKEEKIQDQRKKTRTKAKSSNAKNTELAGEITILVILTVCILLVLSNFGIGGIAGEAVSSVLFGLFGYMAYVLPFLVFAAAAFFISNRGNTHAYIKIAAGVFLFLFLTAILELIFNSYTPGTKLISYYTAASEHHNAGGLTGGCMISMLCFDREDRNICCLSCFIGDMHHIDYRKIIVSSDRPKK
mgnify:CR=1 FL=1